MPSYVNLPGEIAEELFEDVAHLHRPQRLGHDLAVSRSLVDVLEPHVLEQPDAAAPPELRDDARLD
jgi:hypothetical protein